MERYHHAPLHLPLIRTRETSLGKPLISDTVMHGMYAAMQHLVAEKRGPEFAADLPRAARGILQDEPEAVLAALFSQLHRRDTVVIQGANPLAQTAVDAWFGHTGAPTLHQLQTDAEECAAIATGVALRIRDKTVVPRDAQSEHRVQPVVVTLVRGFPPLTSVLRLVQQHDLALLLVVGGEPESRADAQRRLHSTSVPILPVDRSDAVAVCRVLQECLLRARNGWGGAVVHATRLPGSQAPLKLMQQHLEKRGLMASTDLDGAGHG